MQNFKTVPSSATWICKCASHTEIKFQSQKVYVSYNYNVCYIFYSFPHNQNGCYSCYSFYRYPRRDLFHFCAIFVPALDHFCPRFTSFFPYFSVSMLCHFCAIFVLFVDRVCDTIESFLSHIYAIFVPFSFNLGEE